MRGNLAAMAGSTHSSVNDGQIWFQVEELKDFSQQDRLVDRAGGIGWTAVRHSVACSPRGTRKTGRCDVADACFKRTRKTGKDQIESRPRRAWRHVARQRALWPGNVCVSSGVRKAEDTKGYSLRQASVPSSERIALAGASAHRRCPQNSHPWLLVPQSPVASGSSWLRPNSSPPSFILTKAHIG